jgi:hypothetical protein
MSVRVRSTSPEAFAHHIQSVSDKIKGKSKKEKKYSVGLHTSSHSSSSVNRSVCSVQVPGDRFGSSSVKRQKASEAFAGAHGLKKVTMLLSLVLCAAADGLLLLLLVVSAR